MRKFGTFANVVGFAPIYEQTSVSFLSSCPGFFEATRGSFAHAKMVVDMCAKEHKIAYIRKQHPFATLLPIIMQNKLPFALAQKIGLEIEEILHATPCRGIFSKDDSLLSGFELKGQIEQDKEYIIVSDVAMRVELSTFSRLFFKTAGRLCAVAVLAWPACNNMQLPVLQLEKLNKKVA